MSMVLGSQPIAVALPNKQDNDFLNGATSLSPRSIFAGSPMSFKMGSLQNRFYPGASPSQPVGPIAIPDLKRNMSNNCERPDPAAFFNSFRQHGDFFMSEEDLCKNYTCCGQALPDLHALVDHFESTHVLVDESEIYFSPALQAYSNSTTTTNITPASVSDTSPPAFDADDMDISEPSPSPPQTPASATAPNHPAITTQSAFDQIRVGPLFRAQHQSSYSSLTGGNGPCPNAFNRYAGYSDYSSNLPGTDPSPSYFVGGPPQKDGYNGGSNICMPTALLFSSSAEPSPLNTPVSSRTGSPEYHQHRQLGYPTHSVPDGTLPLHPSSSSSASTSFRVPSQTSTQRSAASGNAGASSSASGSPSSAVPILVHKPFRCPKVGCNKSYKQQNGLKYHLSHGQCNFTPRDPEVDRLTEAERDKRMRPFVCKVGTECNRRYKNMNGLRYHYTHTGEHGQVGLEMLNRGVHPLPDAPNGTGQLRSSPGGKSAGSSVMSTPMGTPTPTQAEFPRASYFSAPAQQGLAGVNSVLSTLPLATPAVVPSPATTATTTATATIQAAASLQMGGGSQQQSQSQMQPYWMKDDGGMVL